MVAEDLTAEVFERAYRYRDTYDSTRSSFSTWLSQIAHNWVNNYLVSEKRRQQHQVPVGDNLDHVPSDEGSPEQQLTVKEAVQRLLACLERLTARDKEIIALRFGSDVRNKEIAGLLGLKEHTVSVILLRALQQLRACQGDS
jgi:RNA polymerase sigma factor (sigma-70 family)